jgi:hypothetical protein
MRNVTPRLRLNAFRLLVEAGGELAEEEGGRDEATRRAALGKLRGMIGDVGRDG